MSAICVIPARGGSRRIEHKNRKIFHGKPIIVYSIEVAQASGLFDRVVVNTDERETAMIAWDHGAAIQVRPAYLANDAIGTQEVMRYALSGHNFEYACCVYATAPMMTAHDLEIGFTSLQSDAWGDYAYVPGWYYWGTTKAFLDGIPLDPLDDIGVPENRWIDINTPEDFAKAEMMYAAWTDRILGRT